MLLCGHVDQVEEKLFMAFAMQPQVSEMSYAGADGSAFTYFCAEDDQPRAMFASPRGKWYTQAHPGAQMLVFSAPVGDAGVVSAAVPVDDIRTP
jgi:hypothetical protein